MHHYLLQQEQQETQQLQLSVKCFGLISETCGLPVDSFLVVKLIEKNKPIKQLVKSKIYWGCLNPEYQQKFKLEFSFKNEQNLLLSVFLHDVKPRLYGWIETTVSKIFGSKDKMFEDFLKIDSKQKKNSTSKMQIICKKKQKSKQQVLCWKLKITAQEIQPLKSFYFFSSKSPYFFIITKSIKNTQTLIYKSQQTKQFNFYEFKQFVIKKRIFQQNYSQFDIKIYQGTEQSQKFVGSMTFSPLDLQRKKPQNLIIKNSINNKIGIINIELIQQFQKYTFADYLDAGIQFKIICNIDFTASNKKPNDPHSLHRISGGRSAYEQALYETLKILLDYDNDKLVPTYGFGAKVFLPNFNSEDKVSHCFPINGDLGNPNLKQINGVIQNYRKSLNYLQFAGPTNFIQIIKNAINQCNTFCSDSSQYMIVFIITDGQLHDIYPVIDLIDKNSHLPMSIIIVGLGQNDFTQMKQLDGDQQPLLNSKGKKVRDIVQFVDYKVCRGSNSNLAVNVLQELPQQVLDFYLKNQITPKRLGELKAQKNKMQSSRGKKISADLKQSLQNKQLSDQKSQKVKQQKKTSKNILDQIYNI